MLYINKLSAIPMKQQVGLASRMRGGATISAEVEQLGPKVRRLHHPMSQVRSRYGIAFWVIILI